MTTIYIPRRIETVAEAEGLAVDTLAICDGWHPRIKNAATWEGRADVTFDHEDMIGWSALIPVEAEEEWGTTANGHTLLRDQLTEEEARADEGATPTRRYVTPWESRTGIDKEIER